eukprot:a508398_29.p2 GENE.a508398_29~~a508398_29.p2  ORF type:complete len:471 (-),score=103.73 a508398_29:1531-2901(-)
MGCGSSRAVVVRPHSVRSSKPSFSARAISSDLLAMMASNKELEMKRLSVVRSLVGFCKVFKRLGLSGGVRTSADVEGLGTLVVSTGFVASKTPAFQTSLPRVADFEGVAQPVCLDSVDETDENLRCFLMLESLARQVRHGIVALAGADFSGTFAVTMTLPCLTIARVHFNLGSFDSPALNADELNTSPATAGLHDNSESLIALWGAAQSFADYLCVRQLMGRARARMAVSETMEYALEVDVSPMASVSKNGGGFSPPGSKAAVSFLLQALQELESSAVRDKASVALSFPSRAADIAIELSCVCMADGCALDLAVPASTSTFARRWNPASEDAISPPAISPRALVYEALANAAALYAQFPDLAQGFLTTASIDGGIEAARCGGHTAALLEVRVPIAGKATEPTAPHVCAIARAVSSAAGMLLLEALDGGVGASLGRLSADVQLLRLLRSSAASSFGQ